MELTKEDFEHILTKTLDKRLSTLPSKDDLTSLESRVATKSDLSNLEARIDAKFEELAQMVAQGFEDLQQRLDVRERVLAIENKFTKLEEALHIKL